MKRSIGLFTIAGTAFAVLIGIGTAEAQTGPMGPGMMQGQAPMMGSGAARGMSTMDRNGDGALDLEEFGANHATMLTLLDDNGDDAVSREEFMSGMPMGGGRMQRMMPMRAQAFDALDANRDSRLTAEELGGHAKEMFALHDLDEDGKITGEEMGPRFHRMR